MRILTLAALCICLFASCSKDEPHPDPQIASGLTGWANFEYAQEADGRWTKYTGHHFLFKFNNDKTVRTVEEDDADRTQHRFTMQYEQGKFTGIGHRYLIYRLTFENGRLGQMYFELPSSILQTTHLYYRADGKLDSTVRKDLKVNNGNNNGIKKEYLWEGENLVKVVLKIPDRNGVQQEYFTDTYTYGDDLLPLSFSKLPEGMEFFLLVEVFRDNWHLYSKRLVKSVVRTYPGSDIREVNDWTHKTDEKGRLVESNFTTIRYEGNEATSESKNSIIYEY